MGKHGTGWGQKGKDVGRMRFWDGDGGGATYQTLLEA